MTHHSEPGSALRCIVGARVSTDEQTKGVSISHQLDAGRQKVAEIGGVIAGYCVEAGVSGALYESREELQRALAALEAGEVDALVWYDLSRLGRDIEYIAAIDKRVTRAGGQILFCTTDYADNADGFLHRGIDSVLFQHARMKTRELNIANRRKAATAGRQPQRSRPPYGFRIINRNDVIRGTHTEDQLGKYEIVAEEAEIVREIFRRYQSGESLRSICSVLQSRGVPTPKGRRKDKIATPDGQFYVGPPVAEWVAATIRQILLNEAHKGRAVFGKQKCVVDENRLKQGHKTISKRIPVDPSQWVIIECPSIVSEETWDFCKARLAAAKVTHAGWPERKYLLTGLLRCPDCKRTLKTQRVKRKHGDTLYYCCRRASPAFSASGIVCNVTRYRADELESKVLRVVCEIMTQPALIEQAFADYRARIEASYSQDTCDEMALRLKQVQKEIKSAVAAQVQAYSKDIDASVYDEHLANLSAQKRTLEFELKAFQAKMENAPSGSDVSRKAHDVAATARDVKKALLSEDVAPHKKQKLLAQIIDAIYTDKTDIQIVFRPGLFTPKQRWVWQNDSWNIEDLT